MLEPCDDTDAAELDCNALFGIVGFGNEEARVILPAAVTEEKPEMALVLGNFWTDELTGGNCAPINLPFGLMNQKNLH